LAVAQEGAAVQGLVHPRRESEDHIPLKILLKEPTLQKKIIKDTFANTHIFYENKKLFKGFCWYKKKGFC
jgi:hypothetical protein